MRRWLVDALCGTLNYAAGNMLVAVNVALRNGPAAVADPFSGEVRFVPKLPGLDPDQEFSRFIPRTKHVITAAMNEARTGGHPEIGPGHLVLGLLSEPDALAARAIVAHGVSLEAVREAVTAALPEAAGEVPDLIPYGPQARKVLELTFREALRLGHNYIGTEHVLLALLELEDGDGALAGLGVSKETAEADFGRALAAVVAERKP